MKNILYVLVFFAFSFCAVNFPLTAPSVACAPKIQDCSFKVVCSGQKHSGYNISKETILKESILLKSKDPNFKNKKELLYRGIPLSRVLEIAGETNITGITIIGRDQYTSYLPLKLIKSEKIIVACKADGNDISPLQGGPLKIIFPSNLNMHPSAYTWYVNTIITDDVINEKLILETNNEIRLLGIEELDKLPLYEKDLLVTIPSGYRHGVQNLTHPSSLTAISVHSLFTDEELKEREITLSPIAGREITLSPEIVKNMEISIIYKINSKPLHPSHGGPFSALLRSSPSHENRSAAESTSLFFLKRISLK